MIQQLILADGARSGFNSIPLIYLASTSTIKFLTPIINLEEMQGTEQSI